MRTVNKPLAMVICQQPHSLLADHLLHIAQCRRANPTDRVKSQSTEKRSGNCQTTPATERLCFDRACPERVEGLSTNGKNLTTTKPDPFTLSLSKGVLRVSKDGNPGGLIHSFCLRVLDARLRGHDGYEPIKMTIPGLNLSGIGKRAICPYYDATAFSLLNSLGTSACFRNRR